jgi:HAD superfamily phosphatase (TIGR01668 family)
MSLFYPTVYRRRITDVTVADLHRFGVRGILLDIDNTLTTHDNPNLTPEVQNWLNMINQEGFALLIVSNNQEDRVAPFAEKIGLPFYAHACKPWPGGYAKAAALLGLSKKECVAIGDQIFTDILGANASGMSSILLEPIEFEVEQKFIVFKRKVERLLLNNKRQRRRKESDYGK